jgi:hypothetical protein
MHDSRVDQSEEIMEPGEDLLVAGRMGCRLTMPLYTVLGLGIKL